MAPVRPNIGLGLVPVLAALAAASFAGPADAYLAYVSNEKGNTVSVVDTDKLETVKTIKVGQRPRGIEVSKDGKFLYVALGDDDTVDIIDTKTDEIVGELPSGPDPELFTQDPTGKFV
ncbi:MAG: beta-propeller fold lactonase family protein, partial [Methylobacteriaceae bacterium]|nr:beta-propeller fold lactonase family protein [Methylobacteriaceae bacterium]